ncbi:MAG: hypothetical protein WC786_04140, partial [Patescibacteria group bacterium]
MPETLAPLRLPLPPTARKQLQGVPRVQITGVPEIAAQVAVVADALHLVPHRVLLWLVDDEDHQRRVIA